MNEPKRALLLGGTGAMGVYLTEELLARGYHVDVVSLDDMTSTRSALRYLRADMSRDEALAPILEKGYDAIVDFLIYKPAAFPLLLSRVRGAVAGAGDVAETAGHIGRQAVSGRA